MGRFGKRIVDSRDSFLYHLALFNGMSTEKIRTLQQNKSLHKYCQELATELNNAGVTMEALIQNLQVDHTMYSVKSIWKAIAKAKFGKDSTATLTTKELQEVYEEVNRMVAGFGIHLAWPSQENTQEYLSSFQSMELAPLKE